MATHIQRIPWTVKASIDVVKLFRGAAEQAIAVAEWVRRTGCALTTGHDMVRHFEPGRVSLECLTCGERTPGWTIGRAA